MKKRGFTLIEMVIVITVLGLLMAFLIPKITEAQAKARDIKRQSDITMIAAALVSYKHDKGEFPGPATTGKCITEYQDELSGYLTSIPQDPSNKGLLERVGGLGSNPIKGGCETGYVYITNPEKTNFILVYPVDPSKKNPNGNYISGGISATNKNGLTSNKVVVMNIFKNTMIPFSNFKESVKQITNGDYFVYIYK